MLSLSRAALIIGYAKQGQAEQAMKYFEDIQHEGIPTNTMIYAYSLKAYCRKLISEKGCRKT